MITHRKSETIRRERGVGISLAAAALALTAAGCSSGSGGSAASARVPRATGDAVSAQPTSLGTILVDGKGRTVYDFANDKTSASTCTDAACAANWPFVPAPASLLRPCQESPAHSEPPPAPTAPASSPSASTPSTPSLGTPHPARPTAKDRSSTAACGPFCPPPARLSPRPTRPVPSKPPTVPATDDPGWWPGDLAPMWQRWRMASLADDADPFQIGGT
jgi:hypothetical protein